MRSSRGKRGFLFWNKFWQWGNLRYLRNRGCYFRQKREVFPPEVKSQLTKILPDYSTSTKATIKVIENLQQVLQKSLEDAKRKMLSKEWRKYCQFQAKFHELNKLQVTSAELVPLFDKINTFLIIYKRKVVKICSPLEFSQLTRESFRKFCTIIFNQVFHPKYISKAETLLSEK